MSYVKLIKENSTLLRIKFRKNWRLSIGSDRNKDTLFSITFDIDIVINNLKITKSLNFL